MMSFWVRDVEEVLETREVDEALEVRELGKEMFETREVADEVVEAREFDELQSLQARDEMIADYV